ncbi:MAG: hypothetical protein H5T92_08095 [Synergistales bacterium]|nr:hypothetical protein [Synergistales bacterium]
MAATTIARQQPVQLGSTASLPDAPLPMTDALGRERSPSPAGKRGKRSRCDIFLKPAQDIRDYVGLTELSGNEPPSFASMRSHKDGATNKCESLAL